MSSWGSYFHLIQWDETKNNHRYIRLLYDAIALDEGIVAAYRFPVNTELEAFYKAINRAQQNVEYHSDTGQIIIHFLSTC